MTESTIHDQNTAQTEGQAPVARKPFVRPEVRHAGGLETLTLLSGNL